MSIAEATEEVSEDVAETIAEEAVEEAEGEGLGFAAAAAGAAVAGATVAGVAAALSDDEEETEGAEAEVEEEAVAEPEAEAETEEDFFTEPESEKEDEERDYISLDDIGICRDVHRCTGFTVDLYRKLDGIHHQILLIILRPALMEDGLGTAKSLPELLCDVGCEGSDQANHHLQSFLIHAGGLGKIHKLVVILHKCGNNRIQAEAFQTL